ncbi:MAG TPA: galactose oxidase early set domain-containing protein [Verrucomicrobiota bacterium]|nr:galactose oxidase early set domain-containing protein [Verrucomicrobiota bacterium]
MGATALIAIAVAPVAVFADAPYNTDPNMPYPNDDLSVRPSGTVTWLSHTNTNPVIHGRVGPLLPTHAMSVHNTLVWKTNEEAPKMLMFHRHSAYTADEMVNPDVVNFMISTPNPGPGTGSNQTAFMNSGNQFNSAMRRSFNQLCYGGYTIIHDVSQSVPQRIRVDQYLDLTQLYDWGHPDAYKYDTEDPKYAPAALNNSDAELNFGATKNMGVSRGLYYDMYCPAFATLEDGRPIFPGGHDMNSQNGNYRIQVFNPDTETWLDRPISCMRAQYNADPADPYSELYFQSKIDEGVPERLIYLPVGNSTNGDCNPHALSSIPGMDYSTNYMQIRLMNPTNGTVTHPTPLQSDMRYARWYPTAIALPGNKAYIFSGWDRDEEAQPAGGTPSNTSTWLQNFINSPDWTNTIAWNWKLAGFLSSSAGTPANRVNIPVPEVYDGTTDTCYALENARLLHPAWYPNGLVVQTGPNEDDWKVLVNSALMFENAAEAAAGGEDDGASSETASRHTYLVDVQGALADPEREVPSVREGKWLKYVDTATNTFAPFSANADLMELDSEGKVVSHRIYHMGGRNSSGTVTASAMYLEMAGLSKVRMPGEPPAPLPKWTTTPGSLVVRARQNYATPMPDGKICIIGGNGTGLSGMEAWSLHVQILDPATGLFSTMDKSQVPRDEHGIIHLWQDGRIFMGGQNRNGLVPSGNPFAPAGDPDLGVPCAQFFEPPYLFDENTNAAVRPVITSYPAQIDYGVDFNVGVDDASDIASVAIVRSGSMSHSICTDRRYIKLPFTNVGENMLRVTAPVLPGTAVGGYYMLFVVKNSGTPCVAKKVVLGTQVASRAW